MNFGPGLSVDICDTVKSRSGLTCLKLLWLRALDKTPWADYTHIQSCLWETDSVVLPIFAAKYEWDGSGETLSLGQTFNF